jgi:hypothetical protein
MLLMKSCVHCDIGFNVYSPQKSRVGGKINECADCVEELGTETAIPYLGVCMGEGKQGGVQILSFSDEQSRATYLKEWRNNSGQNKGRSCQIGKHTSSMQGLKFKKVGETPANTNHKGRAE